MARSDLRRSTLLLLAFTSTPVLAQANGSPEPEVIIVTGYRDATGITPERQLGQRDIEAYGLGSIGELIGELADENGGPENSLFLVNGRRISDLDELSDYPPEALERVDVLGAGAGAHAGEPSARQTYNLVLQKRFDGRIGRGAARVATKGGWSSRRGDVSYTRVRGQRRINLRLALRDEDRLLESDRGIVQPLEATTDAGRFRSLRPELFGIDFGVSTAAPLTDWLDFSASGKLSLDRSEALLGFAPALNGGREQDGRTVRGKLNTTLNGNRAGWDLTLLGRYEQGRRRVLTDGDSFTTARNRSFGLNRNAELEFTASRGLFEVPAGPIQLTLGANLAADRTTSRVRRSGANTRSSLSERSRTLSAGVIVPLASRSGGFLPALGELYLATDFGVTRFKGSGSASNRQLSLNWQPSTLVQMFGTLSRNSTPPLASFRREPLVETPGVRYFDPLRNETVEVTEVSGGIATVARQRSIQRQLGLTVAPRGPTNLRLSAEYGYRSDRNLLSALPQASPTILAIFPERFIRDPSGRLVLVDVRPVLFAGRTERELRSTVNSSFPLRGRAARDTEEEGNSDERQEGGGEERSGPDPRLQLSLTHTYLFSSRLDLGGGRPPIDLLSRRAVAFAGGRPRHQLDGSVGVSARGLGLRLTGSHRSRSFLELGEGGQNPDVLRFGSLTTLNLRAFANADRLFGRTPWTGGSRITLSVTNLANARQQVQDGFGSTPLAYQPAYRDPVGRSVELELRKRL